MKAVRQDNSLFLGRARLFVTFRPLTDWMRPAHIREGNLLYWVHWLNVVCMHVKLLQSYLILCNPMDYRPPGSSVHWFLKGRILAAAAAKLLQSCPTLCDPIDGSPPGSPVPGILQARILEWGCHFLLRYMKVKSERVIWIVVIYWSNLLLMF